MEDTQQGFDTERGKVDRNCKGLPIYTLNLKLENKKFFSSLWKEPFMKVKLLVKFFPSVKHF